MHHFFDCLIVVKLFQVVSLVVTPFQQCNTPSVTLSCHWCHSFKLISILASIRYHIYIDSVVNHTCFCVQIVFDVFF